MYQFDSATSAGGGASMITLRKRKVFTSDISPESISVKTKFIIEMKDNYGQFQPFTESGVELYHDTPESRNLALENAVNHFRDAGCKVRLLK